MKPYLRLTRQWLLMVPPFIATSIFINIPTNAATLAFSESDIKFTNFSESIGRIELVNNADISGVANGGVFGGQNNASNNTTTSPPEVDSSAFSLAFGDNRDYEGTAQTQAKIVGNFDVDAGELFSFDFAVKLNIETAIDNPLIEKAGARGNIYFFLFETTNISPDGIQNLDDVFSSIDAGVKYNPLEYFKLNGNLNTFGLEDFINYQQSTNIKVKQQLLQSDFGGISEFASASVRGSLQHQFKSKSNVTLLALRRNKASVSIPEPALGIALILFAIIILFALFSQRRSFPRNY
jgi:hypothetical protein